MAVYQPNIPTGLVNLDIDYQNVQGNFEQANTVYGNDHYPFDNASANQGKHQKSTYVKQSPDPTTIAGEGCVYTKDSASTPGRTDFYYKYQTSVGTKFTGLEFPLTWIKAFGRVLSTGGGSIVAGSSFNVTSATFSVDTFTINLTNDVCAGADVGKVIVLATSEVNSSLGVSVSMVKTITLPNQIIIRVNGNATPDALHFAVACI